MSKIFLNVFQRAFLSRSMAPKRYFPNTAPDQDDFEIPTQFCTGFLEKIVHDIEKSIKPIEANGSDGLYLGTAGISYMYYHLSKNPDLIQHKQDFLQKAQIYLEPALTAMKQSSKKDAAAFLLGNLGVYAVAATIHKASGNEKVSEEFRRRFLEAGRICKEMDFLNCGSDEFLVGRAGYIIGTVWLHKELKLDLPLQDLYNLCDIVIGSGRRYAEVHHNTTCPLMYAYYQTEYFGAAHGLCIILQALLTVPDYINTKSDIAKDVRNSVDYLLSLQDSSGNFPCTSDEIGTTASELIHWCHGAPGVIYLMAKAYLIWKDKKYLASCEKMGDLIWKKGLLKKGPGICHGIAGNGYSFLLLYRLTGEKKYLYRASSFANFMQTEQFLAEARTPDYPFSLYEGFAGTACYLGDLLAPQQAAFPFSDVME